MPYDLAVNKPLSVQTHYAGHERQPILIIDNYLRNPESLVKYAEKEARFEASPAMYPGIVSGIPDDYCETFLNTLGPLVGETFGVQVETAYLTSCFFAIITFSAEQLHFRQRLPHVDDYGAGVIAMIHFLCDEFQGGTGLFRHRATGYESLTEAKYKHLQSLIAQDIASTGPIAPEYMSANNRWFEQTACIPAKFNRLAIYRGSILHSMLVDDKTKLHPNPRIGRLTINTFLRFETA
jgi:hypothetical protein